VFYQPQRRSFTSEINQMDAKIDQMVGIVGEEISRERLANFLDGAGGNVQVALEHYFMTLSALEATPVENKPLFPPAPPPVETSPDQAAAQAQVAAAAAAVSVQAHHNHRPMSDLIIPIPSLVEPLHSPTHDTAASTQQIEASFKEEEEDTYAAFESAALTASKSRRGFSSDSITVETSGYAEPEEPEALTIHDFEMVSVLGKGSFGAVMLVRFKKDGRIFALKIIKKSGMDKADIRNAMEERQILQRIQHPYICSLTFAFQTNERLYLGMKYYAAGDLFYHLNMRGQLPVRDTQLYAAELVLAISYLHDLNILYRDLKPSNIMIDSDGHIGVVDFGLSKQHIYGSSHGVKTLSGTAEYVAPEALAQMADGSRSYGKVYDWWSLGVVIVRAPL
jgi:tRNA A-37 threonylcarbamoyl transferase component Bud32